MEQSARYTLHLPADVDVNASYWCIDSRSGAKEQLAISSKTNTRGDPIAELHVDEPVQLELKTLQAQESTTITLNHPGCYVIQPAAPAAAQRALRRPVMLVSDLDDTLIGSSEEMDEGTEQFNAFWRASRATVPCQLVYNTGRTLSLYEDVWALKKHCMPSPDALVCGVGTRVYFPAADGAGWEEDAGWTARLEDGWDYQHVREALDAIIADLGVDRVRYQSEPELNRHKQTVKVQTDIVLQVTGLLQGALSLRAVQAVLITGGLEPEWRFIDVVPLGAGKGAALEYVRDKLGYSEADTVAAGDSANDYLMLEHSQHSVVVDNCVPELRAWVHANKSLRKVVHAEGDEGGSVEGSTGVDGKVIVLASKKGARGVLQGLEALGFA